MVISNHDDWWRQEDPSYDSERAGRLHRALRALIDRDVNFDLNAMVQGYHYPEDVDLGVCVEGPEDEDDEDAVEDTTFMLTGPEFRVVIISVREPKSGKLLNELLDEVVGEGHALSWLEDPDLPEAAGYK